MDVARFVADWIAHWNAKDHEAVLAYYAEDAVFHSPKAVGLVGTGAVHGKAALRTYWSTAVQRIARIHFTLLHHAWDPERRELFIVYVAELNDQKTRACERLRFVGDHVVEGEGLYGAPL
jgi:hypothetical protein